MNAQVGHIQQAHRGPAHEKEREGALSYHGL